MEQLYEARLSLTIIGRFRTYAEAEAAIEQRVASWKVPGLVVHGQIKRVTGGVS